MTPLRMSLSSKNNRCTTYVLEWLSLYSRLDTPILVFTVPILVFTVPRHSNMLRGSGSVIDKCKMFDVLHLSSLCMYTLNDPFFHVRALTVS